MAVISRKSDYELDISFIKAVKNHSVILDKSMVPEIRKKKMKSLIDIRKNIHDEIGKDISEKQIIKKLTNMKNRLKKKSDTNQTGNRKIVLKDWEVQLLKLLEGDSNPTIVRVNGK